MAVTLSSRLSLYRWSSDSDAYTREQFDYNMGRLDELAAIFRQGVAADRSSAARDRSFYYATDTGRLSFRIDGTWYDVPSVVTRGSAPTTGTWGLGQIVYNTSPNAGGFIGWVCVEAGTPGVWRTWGAISA